MQLELWDTAGIERFATLSSSYFQSASGAILCYAIDNHDSFDMLSQHILDTVMHSRTAKMFLCGIKQDLSNEESVTDDDIKDFMGQCDAVVSGVYRVSCKTGEGVAEMFSDVAQVLFHEAEQKFDPSRVKAHEPVPVQPAQKSSCCWGWDWLENWWEELQGCRW